VPTHAQRMSSLLGADKEFASCQSRKGGVYIMGGEVCVPGGGREGTRRQRRHARGATQGLGAKGTRGAHDEHGAHVRDAGGVEAQWLVEGRRVLPSRRGGHAMRGRRGASRKAGGPVVWWRHTGGMHGEKARVKAWGPRARAERT